MVRILALVARLGRLVRRLVWASLGISLRWPQLWLPSPPHPTSGPFSGPSIPVLPLRCDRQTAVPLPLLLRHSDEDEWKPTSVVNMMECFYQGTAILLRTGLTCLETFAKSGSSLWVTGDTLPEVREMVWSSACMVALLSSLLVIQGKVWARKNSIG